MIPQDGQIVYTGRCNYCGKQLTMFEEVSDNPEKRRQMEEFYCPNQIGVGMGRCAPDQWHQEIK